METNVISDEEILRGLHEHPQIRQRVASLLSAAQDAGGDLKRVDDAEQRLSEALRRLGQEAMQGWAGLSARFAPPSRNRVEAGERTARVKSTKG